MADEEAKYKRLTVKLDALVGENIANIESNLKKFTSVIKNLSDSGEAFVTQTRKYNDSVSKDYYVRADRAAQAKKGFDSVRNSLVHSSSPTDPSSDIINPVNDIAEADVTMTRFTKKIMGNVRKIAEFKRYITSYGGSMTALPEQGMYDISVPNAVIGVSGTGNQVTIASTIKKSINSNNSYVSRKARQEAEAKEAARAEKAEKAESAREEKRAEKRKEKSNVDGNEDTSDKFGSIKTLTHLATIVFLVKKLIDVVSTFFLGMTKAADQAVKDTAAGMRAGLSGIRVMQYGVGDAAKGMPKDTTVGAIQAINDKFANIAAINEKDITPIALFLGNSVKEFIMSGSGGDFNPEQLNDMLVLSMIERTMRGQNQFGMNVGSVSDAMRVNASYMQGFSPEVVTEFLTRMKDVLDQTLPATSRDVARGGTMLEFTSSRNSALVNPAGLTGIDQAALKGIDRLANEISALVSALKTGWFAKMALDVSGILSFVRSLARVAMDDEAKAIDIDAARADSEARLPELQELSAYSDKEAQKSLATLNSFRSVKGKNRYTEEDLLLASTGSKLPDAIAGATPAEVLAFLDAVTAFTVAREASGTVTTIEGNIADSESDWIPASPASVHAKAKRKAQEGIKNAMKGSSLNLVETVTATIMANNANGLLYSLATDKWLDDQKKTTPAYKMHAANAREIRTKSQEDLIRFEATQAISDYVASVPGASTANKVVTLEVGDSTQTIIIKDEKTGKEVFRGAVESSLGGQSITFDAETLNVVRNSTGSTANAFKSNAYAPAKVEAFK